MRILPIVLAVVLPACMLDEESAPDDPILGEIAAEVNTTNLVVWPRQNGTYLQEWDLGPSAGRACFLAGLVGYGSARIVPRDGHWIAEALPTSSLQLTTVCVTSPNQALTPEVMWNGGAPSAVVASAAPKHRCFLTGATSHTENPGESGEVTAYRGFWMLGGTSTHNRFYARCLTTTATINSVAIAAPAGGTATVVAAANPGGVACALTGLGTAAAIIHNEVPRGAGLRYQDGGWFLDAGNGRSASATCFQ